MAYTGHRQITGNTLEHVPRALLRNRTAGNSVFGSLTAMPEAAASACRKAHRPLSMEGTTCGCLVRPRSAAGRRGLCEPAEVSRPRGVVEQDTRGAAGGSGTSVDRSEGRA